MEMRIGEELRLGPGITIYGCTVMMFVAGWVAGYHD